jgi:uncharacterized protein YcaQ
VTARVRATVSVPRRAVAALFLERQHLDRPRGRRLTAASLTRFVEDAGGLQLDTINVVDRAHYLTLWSRFGPYPRHTLDRLVYGRRTLFEYWAHAACLVPMSHLPHWRHMMQIFGTRPLDAHWRRWLRRGRPVLEAVLDAIRERGPLANADFEHDRKGRPSGWWDRKPQAHALDYLWMTGRLAVHSRTHFQKRYDLAERVVPELLGVEPPDGDAFRRWHTRQSLRAMGAATETDLRMYLTFPRIPITERRRTLEAMRRDGEVVEVEVADLAPHRPQRGPWLMLRDDLPALERAARRRSASKGTALLSPFDSLLWHRERVGALFGYDYKIEVYVPASQRRHGYYSLPILHDGHLIGRLDPKTWREERRLEVRRVHFEPWFVKGQPAPGGGPVDRDAALTGVAEALGSLALFVGADRVTLGRVSPAVLRSPLRRALKSMPVPAAGARRVVPGHGGGS